jgi:hypothetical protein
MLRVSLPQAGGGVEGLGHRDEGDAMRVEQFDQLGEVGKRPRQPVDLVDDNHVDLTGLNILQQLLERRALHRTPEKPPSS